MLTKDVLIIGGGLVGGTLACALARSGVSVAVVDATAPETLLAAEADGRWSALALSSRALFEALDLWAPLAPGSQPITDIRVCDNHAPQILDFDGPGPLGVMVENRSVRRALFARLAALPAATVLAPARLRHLERHTDRVEATLDTGQRIQAALVVGADGRDSQVRTEAAIGLTRRTYGQSALVQTVGHAEPHDGLAVELFLPGGPFAILPLPGRRSLVVWSERAAWVTDLLALPPARFLGELAHRFGDFLGPLTLEGRAFAYPLGFSVAERLVERRLVLVGDAAHGMHPVAGQGFNYGLRDVAALTEILVEGHRLGRDPGDASALAAYQAWRRPDTFVMLAATDALVRLFSNDIAPVRVARRLGLAAVNRIGPLKGILRDHAMGRRAIGPVPKLLRGTPL
ncbi:UbiH/UbiF/VisC/COQ6 family ubiquinone biosynthesis hydroxylase [Pararhodospirillum photometricum]|uniref:2-octaprenyl-3-methyl-6-methoxy-1,4-benzoquinol hydroxylase / 2-octaprenyl-6-methoxyphenol hydroxylase n=1 Tax=Pararhodospirillum photometricum DSM 122 TaxID=1150469 RepID=H6SQU0_PARPM|nr:UbiH/UbiF/VisC/COQ6 family ubiquinone biosynthesis hydroxylase [Pararhodospirillum photometricum]CCG07405.1 2-octaprenyl-3-methyl-6-methoxy-1,4-benzoquinol hydroxylase / 2-octaprenyl-6-methoxyphenol hydroxylase [Pararhodospirillum photometricum DSM 122]